MTLSEILTVRKPDILRLAAERGARNVRVFGSVARGDSRPDSDVDFLVDMEPGRSLFDLGGLLMDLQELLGCQVDVVTEKGLRARIKRARIVRGGAALRGDSDRLEDILEAIDRIERYANQGRAKFDSDELIQVWIIYHLLVIGEACRSLSSEALAKSPNLPLKEIVGMRNALVHHYFGIDLDVVWAVVADQLAAFKATVEELSNELA